MPHRVLRGPNSPRPNLTKNAKKSPDLAKNLLKMPLLGSGNHPFIDLSHISKSITNASLSIAYPKQRRNPPIITRIPVKKTKRYLF